RRRGEARPLGSGRAAHDGLGRSAARTARRPGGAGRDPGQAADAGQARVGGCGIDGVSRGTGAGAITGRMRPIMKPGARTTRDLAEGTLVDALTGLPNRRYLVWRLAEEVRRYERFGDGIGVVWIVLDGLATMQEQSGRDAVAEAVRASAACVVHNSRNPIALARFDEHAFAAVLPGATRLQTMSYANRIARMLALLPPGQNLSARLEVLVVPDDAVST